MKAGRIISKEFRCSWYIIHHFQLIREVRFVSSYGDSERESNMVSLQDFRKLLTIENKIIQEQTAGLSQAETLIQPQPGGNCMNWVLGHLLESQIILLETLGGESPVAKSLIARYGRESLPVLLDGDDVIPLERLLVDHNRVFSAIRLRLLEMIEEDMTEEIPAGDKMVTRGWRVFFLHFHYTYHIGQLEQLRQLAGKLDKVI